MAIFTRSKLKKQNCRELGASLIEMSLLVALIALVSIQAITYMGESAEKVMCKGKMLSADFNGDSKINNLDVLAFGPLMGAVTPANEHADLNCDDVVNGADLAIFTSYI